MNKKPKRYFHWKKSNNAKYIQPSSSGLFFTVDGDDKRAVREAYNLLDSYTAKENSNELNQKQTEIKKQDVSDLLTQMCAETAIKKDQKNLYQLDTGVKHTLFFCAPEIFTPESVYEITNQILEDCQKNQRCRFLAKILPIEDSCVGDFSALPERILFLVKKHFTSFSIEKSPSYAVEFKARNSDLIDKKLILDIVTNAVANVSPTSRVNLNTPDLLICVNLIRKTVLLSCIKNYHSKHRYSMRPIELKEKIIENNNELLNVCL